MKRNMISPLARLLLLAVLMLAPAIAGTDQPYSDKVVGYWVSSSGTPISLAYSGDASTFLVQIQVPNQPTTDYVATWVDGTRFSYTTSDGSTINGWVNDANRISVFNPATNWKAEWHRR